MTITRERAILELKCHRNSLIKAINEKEYAVYQMAIDSLENQKTGHWQDSCPVVSDGELWKSWVCSECDYRTMSKSLYCPYCGAKMEGE